MPINYFIHCNKMADYWLLVIQFALASFYCIRAELTGAGIDIRCKCVCPHEETATSNNTIFIQKIDDPSECLCESVVLRQIHPLTDDTICLKCVCEHEIRNTWIIWPSIVITLIAIVLIAIYVCVVFPLLQLFFKYKGKKAAPTAYRPLSEYQMSFRDRLEAYQLRWRRRVEEQRQRNLI